LALLTPEETVAHIYAEVGDAVAAMEDVLAEYEEKLAGATSQGEADEARQGALENVRSAEGDARTKIQELAAEYHSNKDVQTAMSESLFILASTKGAATDRIEEMYEAWLAGQSTTATTKVPPTTLPPSPAKTTTTTTTEQAPTTSTTTTTPTTTTTTTVPAAVLLPDLPDKPESSFMAVAQEPAVMVSSGSASTDMVDEDAMPMVGFVTRVVDSQLPASISAIAVGPLVVLGLVFDAIRSAGIIMMIPWILLIGYMAVLLVANRLSPQHAAAELAAN
jgi:hypothetical protein